MAKAKFCRRRIKGLLLSGFWAAAMVVLWHPACGTLVQHSRLPGRCAIREFGALGYYRVRVNSESFEGKIAGGIDRESLVMTIVGSLIVSGACLLEWCLTADRSGRGRATSL